MFICICYLSCVRFFSLFAFYFSLFLFTVFSFSYGRGRECAMLNRCTKIISFFFLLFSFDIPCEQISSSFVLSHSFHTNRKFYYDYHYFSLMLLFVSYSYSSYLFKHFFLFLQNECHLVK